ncbi:MAG: transcriptional repressor [Phycisphaerales bacterium]|nr:transcriptional repressor [Phycisphaerales bacterium]MCB9835583.1 transcriptional repressor [Phycisphaera sp.]
MPSAVPHRDAVLGLIRSLGRPVSADEIRDALRETGIGIATVYRIVNKAVEEGDLAKVELPGAPARFEPADLPHHHHFECDACKRVYDVPGCAKGVTGLAPEGFAVESHEIILRGTCRECSGVAV